MLNSVMHEPFTLSLAGSLTFCGAGSLLSLTALNVKRDSTIFVGEAALGLPSDI